MALSQIDKEIGKVGYLILDKKAGETPLEALNRLRIERPELKRSKLSYAGRLDPLATGELLVLVDDACKHKTEYMRFDKTYKIDVLFGMSTDTGDVLGKIKQVFCPVNIDKKQFEQVVTETSKKFIGEHQQTFPAYSSRNIKKVLNEEIPDPSEKRIHIYSIENEGVSAIDAKKLQKIIKEKIDSVSGNFRQKDILEKWSEFFEKNTQKEFVTATLVIHCSSGTYMRVLAEDIGREIGLPALALNIRREKIHIAV